MSSVETEPALWSSNLHGLCPSPKLGMDVGGRNFLASREALIDVFRAAHEGTSSEFEKAWVKAESVFGCKGAGLITEMKDGNGSTCLHFAARAGNMQVVNYLGNLIHANSTRNVWGVKDVNGRTALFVAVRDGQTETAMSILSQMGHSLSSLAILVSPVDSLRCLDVCAASGDIKLVEAIVKFLQSGKHRLSNYWDIYSTKKASGACLQYAISSAQIEVAEFLIDNLPSASLPCRALDLPPEFILAAALPDMSVARQLCEKMIKKWGREKMMQQVDKNGFTAMDCALELGNTQLIELLNEY